MAIAIAAALTLASGGKATAQIVFSTFVQNADINAAVGQTNVISYSYAGNKFVGGLYPNDGQLYSTDLNGKNVQKFGVVPNASGEVVLGVSLGKAGFPSGDIFAGSGNDGNIYQFANGGGASSLFASLPTGQVRQIIFDTGSKFGGNMIVTTTAGDIYKVDSGGTPKLIASVGSDTEGVDIITAAWGTLAGDLLVASEGSGTVRVIDENGIITDTGLIIPAAESVSFVPLNLGASGNPLEGLYVANYPVDIQKAEAKNFAGLQGDAIVSSEFGNNAPFYDIKYDPNTQIFSLGNSGNPIGLLPNQAEDAIFVTADRITDIGAVPEPASILLLGTGGIGMLGGLWLRRRRTA